MLWIGGWLAEVRPGNLDRPVNLFYFGTASIIPKLNQISFQLAYLQVPPYSPPREREGPTRELRVWFGYSIVR